jgi:two-component system, chemotaxis family, chemotaxis protein CheY
MAKVMVVDDSAYARRVHCAMIERSGHSVIEAATGSGAIELFCHDRPDVVVLDLSMEDIGGLDVLRTLLEIDSAAKVVVVSADVQRSTENSVLAAGARRFLGKPASEAKLIEAIAALQGDTAA